jgi:hypothetical protein
MKIKTELPSSKNPKKEIFVSFDLTSNDFNAKSNGLLSPKQPPKSILKQYINYCEKGKDGELTDL